MILILWLACNLHFLAEYVLCKPFNGLKNCVPMSLIVSLQEREPLSSHSHPVKKNVMTGVAPAFTTYVENNIFHLWPIINMLGKS